MTGRRAARRAGRVGDIEAIGVDTAMRLFSCPVNLRATADTLSCKMDGSVICVNQMFYYAAGDAICL
jgi:hypothetical protein